MTEGTRWQFVGFVAVLVVLYFLLRVGLGLGALAPDFLVIALLLAARRMRGGVGGGAGPGPGRAGRGGAPAHHGRGRASPSPSSGTWARARGRFLSGDSPVVLALYLFAGKWIYDVLMWVLMLARSTAFGAAGHPPW
jgi:hypothetical protein